MQSLTSNHVIDALEAFRADAGGIPRTFHSNFDKKLIGGKALKWILNNDSKVGAASARHQSSNGVVERTWRFVITIAWAYIIEKQVGCEFWYFALVHSASMINQISGRLGRKLTTPFEAVHNKKPDSKT